MNSLGREGHNRSYEYPASAVIVRTRYTLHRLGVRRVPVCLLVAMNLAGTGCYRMTVPPPSGADSVLARDDLRQATSRYFTQVLRNRPDVAGALGKRLEGFPSPIMRDRGAREALARRLRSDMNDIDANALSPEEYAALQVLRWEVELLGESGAYRDQDFSLLSPRGSSLTASLRALRALPVTTPGELSAYVYYLDEIALWLSDARGELQARAERGVVASGEQVRTFVAFLKRWKSLLDAGAMQVEPARLAQPFDSAAAVDSLLRAEFRNQETESLDLRVRPALDSLVYYLEFPYQQGASQRVGVWQYPGGKEFYRYLLRLHLGMEVDPEEVHRAGVVRLRRVDSLLAQVRTQLGWSGSVRALHDSLRRRTDLQPISVDSAVVLLRATMRMTLDSGGASLDNAPVELPVVRAASPMQALLDPEGQVAPPEYADSSTVLYATPWWGSVPARLEGRALALRLGFPGQAYATAVAWQQPAAVVVLHASPPWVEGWGEYVASLGGELGLYRDPLAAYGRLLQEAFVAALLVVDTGVHYYGWTRQQALDVLQSHTVSSPTEVDSIFAARIASDPGRSGAAATGLREFSAMRAWMQGTLGPEFSSAQWHHEVMRMGPLPLPVLAAHLEWWSWNQRRAAADRARQRQRPRPSP